MKMCYIYVLISPQDDKIRYVGKANNIKKRLNSHLAICNLTKKTHKNNWIKSLLKQGLRPSIEIIDTVPIEEWKFWEQYWISQFKSWGFNLTNSTAGGDCVIPKINLGDKNQNYNFNIKDEEILKLIASGKSQKEIASILNTNIALVGNRMKKFKINFRKNRGIRITNGETHNFRNDITKEIVLKLTERGFSINKIAKELKSDRGTIKRRLESHENR